MQITSTRSSATRAIRSSATSKAMLSSMNLKPNLSRSRRYIYGRFQSLPPPPPPPSTPAQIQGMDRVLPVELWLQIFCFACVDGGETGCSLSLVSKYFRDMSLEVKFQCVAVEMDQMPILVKALKQAPPEHVKIKHILITTHSETPSYDPVNGEREPSPAGLYQKTRHVSWYPLFP